MPQQTKGKCMLKSGSKSTTSMLQIIVLFILVKVNMLIFKMQFHRICFYLFLNNWGLRRTNNNKLSKKQTAGEVECVYLVGVQ